MKNTKATLLDSGESANHKIINAYIRVRIYALIVTVILFIMTVIIVCQNESLTQKDAVIKNRTEAVESYKSQLLTQ